VPNSWLHMNDNVMDPWHVQCCTRRSRCRSIAAEFATVPESVDFEDDTRHGTTAVREAAGTVAASIALRRWFMRTS
jgi:hypothetical protein